MSKYNNAKIYKIYSPEGDEIYIGSTTLSLNQRFYRHKCQLNCTSKILFEKYTDVRIELIMNYPCESKQELNVKEGEYIRNTTNCINNRIAGRTKKEYDKDNKDKRKEYHQQYIKEYRQQNKDKIREQNKEYYEQNKEYMRQRRQKLKQ